jgi:AcrR family transcriptional regulator
VYGGQGASERQAGRRERLRTSALELIATSGTTAVTINSVCAGAGLNKRYFYESYPSRDALLVELLGSFFDDFYARSQRELQDAGPGIELRARHAVSSLLAVLESDPGVARLYAESGSEPGLVDLRTAQYERFTDIAGALADLDTADPTTRYALRALVIGVTEALMHWLREDPPTMGREQVLDTSVRFLLAAMP